MLLHSKSILRRKSAGASTRRSASRLDSNYLTAEVNSAYNNSPLRCELTRDFARGTHGALKCSGEVNSPCANAFAQQKHFTAQKRRGTVWVGVPAPIGSARRSCRGAAMRDGVLRSIETAGRCCPVGARRDGRLLRSVIVGRGGLAGQDAGENGGGVEDGADEVGGFAEIEKRNDSGYDSDEGCAAEGHAAGSLQNEAETTAEGERFFRRKDRDP